MGAVSPGLAGPGRCAGAKHASRNPRSTTEIGGTSLGDLNGDGLSDYLLTFEGHAEICYSNGIDGFDCRVIEDDTGNWTPPAYFYGYFNTKNPQSTSSQTSFPVQPPSITPTVVTPYGTGFSAYSVLSVGHATDHNSTEVIYKLGDGNGNSNNPGDASAAMSGDNIYQVCTVRDGMRNCGNTPYWSGPKPIRTTMATNWEYFTGQGYGWMPSPVWTYSPTGTLVGDFTGYGKTEILWYCNDNTQNQNSHNDNPAAETVPTICGMPGWQLYTSSVNPQSAIPTDRLVSVQNGLGNTTTIGYKPLSDPSVYVRQASDKSSPVFPVRRLADGGRMVVASLGQDTGSGNKATSTYFYEGLATDPTGRGDQGFERITITDPQGTIHSTQYAQGFPYTGMEMGYTMFASASELVSIDCSAYAGSLALGLPTGAPNAPGLLDFRCSKFGVVTNPAGTGGSGGVTVTQIPYAPISQELVHQDLDGSPLPLTSHAVQLTSYGDVQSETQQVAGRAGQPAPTQADIFTTATSNTWNYSQSPYVAELLLSAVNKFSTTEAQVTRVKQRDYYGQGVAGYCTPVASGLNGNAGTLADEIVMGVNGPASSLTTAACSAAIALQTTYGRDPFGNVNQTNQYWTDVVKGAQTRVNLKAWFDTNGRYLAQSQNALGFSLGTGQLLTQYQFDAGTGAKTSLTDINGLTTTWVPDGFGRTTRELHADGTETDYAIVQCAPNGGNTCPNNVDGQQAFTASIVSHYFSGIGGTAARVQIGVPEIALADTAGHTIRHITWGYDGSEIDSDSTYDADGRLDHTYQPLYKGSQPYLHHQDVYDELNRVFQHIEHDEVGNPELTQNTYQGMATQVTNPKGKSRTDYRDAIGQVAQMKDAMGNLTVYVRDAWGNLAKVTDSNQNATQIQYDALGHKTDLLDPDLGHIRYCVDARGLTWQQVSPIAANAIGASVSNGNYCTQAWTQADNMGFDLLDRMTSRTEPSLRSYWVYDSTSGAANCTSAKTCGKLVQACTGGSGCSDTANRDYSRTQAYDSLSRPTATTTSLYSVNGLSGSFVSTTNYDTWGRPCGITRQPGSGTAVTFANAYSSTGYLSQIVRVGVDATTPCSSYSSNAPYVLWQADEQDASSRVTASSLGNGLTVSRSYDPFTGHLADSSVVAGGNINVVSEGYQYDVLNNVTNRTEQWGSSAGFSEGFGYDDLNRLTSSQVLTKAAQSFGFDNLGNITSKSGVGSGTVTVNGVPTTVPGQYRYSQTACTGAAKPGPHAVTSIDGVTSGNNGAFCYDADGNLLSDPWRSTTWTSFDMPNRITQGSSYSQFTYGPEHQRTRQTRSDITLLYDDGMEIDTPTSGSGSNTIKVYWPAGLGVETSTGSTPVYNWTHSDNLDSVVAITDQSGNVAQSMAFDAWGARRDLAGDPGVDSAANGYLDSKALIDNKGFTHQEELDQLGLVHLNGRVYDPFTGRFMSGDPEVQDPYHSQSYNRYTYVWNNPTNMTDPTGFDGQDVEEGKSQRVEVSSKREPANPRPKMTIGAYMRRVQQPSKIHQGLSLVKGLATGAWNDATKAVQHFRPNGTGPSMYDWVGRDLLQLDESGDAEFEFGADLGPAALMMVPGLGEEEAEAVGSEKLEETLANCLKCFVRGTLVRTPAGYKPIDKIRIGDLVASRDELTGETAWKPVLHTFHHHKQVILRLRFTNSDGKVEELGVTEEHPFMLENKHWIVANQLKPGDRILSYEPGVLTVVDLHRYTKKHDTYNLEVADFHTFFVGRMEAWVHNSAGCKEIIEQIHHFATNKSSKYTEALAKVAKKYGLDLDGEWNKALLEHQGRHPEAYHEWVLDTMKKIDKTAAGSQEKFLELFNTYVKEPVMQSPEMLRKAWWN